MSRTSRHESRTTPNSFLSGSANTMNRIPNPRLPRSGSDRYSGRMDPGEQPGFLARWRGPLLGLGVLGALTIAGAAILTVILMVVALANLLTSLP
jgi:hypothetical protein